MDPAVRRFYRINIWLPVLLPLVAGVLSRILVDVLGARPAGIIGATLQFLASLIFFGVPYIPFALFATWWIRKRDEGATRLLMFVLPAVMMAVAVIACMLMALISERMRMWMEVAAFAVTVIVLIGYGFVALTVVLRLVFGRRLTQIASPAP